MAAYFEFSNKKQFPLSHHLSGLSLHAMSQVIWIFIDRITFLKKLAPKKWENDPFILKHPKHNVAWALNITNNLLKKNLVYLQNKNSILKYMKITITN